MSEANPAPQAEARPAPHVEAEPAVAPPFFGEWSAPTSVQHREPAEVLSEVKLEPMRPMRPLMDLGEAIAKGMAPSADMMPHIEGPMLDAGDQQSSPTPMFRRGLSAGYSGMVCPIGSIGNCIYCAQMPCTLLKSKVLEIVAMEYKLLAGQPVKR